MQTVIVIGLTGGIASGKSTVSKTLKELGAYIIDGDETAHSVIEPHKPAWRDMLDAFGRDILNPDDTIDRDKMGAIVFGNPDQLARLNQITHPRIMESFKEDYRRIKAANPNAILVLEIPLLYETFMDRMCDEVWVVWVDYETQLKRLMDRNHYSLEEAKSRIESQIPLDEKAHRADVVINNCGSIQETISSATKYFNDILERQKI
ncbi:MAG TPA: dephospho-CoA kinase [Syntrophomonas sp.]|nr:dephospho-CoA kinase [Syntrophomonas sp.]